MLEDENKTEFSIYALNNEHLSLLTEEYNEAKKVDATFVKHYESNLQYHVEHMATDIDDEIDNDDDTPN